MRLLSFAGCPNWHEADQRLRRALREGGVTTSVDRVSVSSPQDAERLSLPSSGADQVRSAAVKTSKWSAT